MGFNTTEIINIKVVGIIIHIKFSINEILYFVLYCGSNERNPKRNTTNYC